MRVSASFHIFSGGNLQEMSIGRYFMDSIKRHENIVKFSYFFLIFHFTLLPFYSELIFSLSTEVIDGVERVSRVKRVDGWSLMAQLPVVISDKGGGLSLHVDRS